MNILGIRIDNFGKKEILEKVGFFLNEPGFHQIATVNPEFVLQAQHDEKFKSILNKCDLNVADGIGLKYAFIRFGKWLRCRMAGTDLMHEILYLAYKYNYKVYVAANKSGLSTFEEIRERLEEMYPSLEIDGADFDPNGDPKPSIANHDILFCNFGAPHQEVFINSAKNDSIRLAMGVGGAFDFVTGKIKRAPKPIQFLGLEWLWRFFQEPKYRFKRIINAVIVFPIKIIFSQKHE
ncbi:MAG: WecB/TagA/CpsF family glycosyltransferase [Candidatus Moranbacteria bacterium]|nr:WecB/TagA/CpsF family glycosyltransferase [Candidatus Moranbacteria bacterium]